MTKNTPTPAEQESNWISTVAETWHDLVQDGKTPNGAALATALAQRLNISAAVVSGLMAGLQSLVGYAQMEREPAASALEEERLSLQAALRAVRPVLEARLQQRLDEADTLSAAAICGGCGQQAIAQGRRRRCWQSTVGKLRLQRRYHWCAACERGLTPAQGEVGLPDGDYTVSFREGGVTIR